MTVKHKLSITELPIHQATPQEGYAPYRKRRCVETGIRRTVSQSKGLHEMHVDLEREKMLRGRSASCPVPLQNIYYAHYLYIREFGVEKGDDYPYLFL